MIQSRRVIAQFYSGAWELRKEFDRVYADPRSTPPQRFIWDHWYLKDQFHHHRTLAREFFSPKVFDRFLGQLIRFGQDQLGCHSVSEPWLSYYTDGCEQKLHTDSPHGPWAYVFSLTPDRAKFRGGETIMLRNEVLTYWSSLNRGRLAQNRGLEASGLFEKVRPRFNQLLVFDPRIPHGVDRVEGPLDPREGRLVIHGWFVKPEPFVTGGLKNAAMTKTLNAQLPEVLNGLDFSSHTGIATFNLKISASGAVKDCKTQSLQWRDDDGKMALKLARATESQLRRLKFPKAAKESSLRLPLILE